MGEAGSVRHGMCCQELPWRGAQKERVLTIIHCERLRKGCTERVSEHVVGVEGAAQDFCAEEFPEGVCVHRALAASSAFSAPVLPQSEALAHNM